MLVLLVAAGAGGFWLLRDRGPDYPAHWDARVAPIAQRVESLRGLKFLHPVKVNYLSQHAFEQRLVSTPQQLKQQRREIDQANSLLRASGLLGAGVDLGKAVNTAQAADTLAYYDFDTKQIYIRQGPFTVDTRVTLAHELTHVLQDQHFDLNKLERRAEASRTGSSDALEALIEGDATHVQNEYLAGLSRTDRLNYADESSKDSAAAESRTQQVPPVVETYFGSPYIFGTALIEAISARGGNAAVNAALTGPTPTTAIYFDPTAVGATPASVAAPRLAPGDRRVTGPAANDNLDPFTFYLILAARLDQPTALRATDTASAISTVLYTHAGTECFKASVDAADHAGVAYLGDVIGRWTRAMPDAALDSTSGPVQFHSCDPGARAIAPSSKTMNDATTLASARLELIGSLVKEVPMRLATCAARLLLQHADVRASVLNDTAPDPSTMTREGRDAGIDCALDPESGLPGHPIPGGSGRILL